MPTRSAITYDLPPITVRQEVPARTRGTHAAEHLNAGITAEQASALAIQAPERPDGILPGWRELAKNILLCAAALILLSGFIFVLYGDRPDMDMLATVLEGLANLGALVALGIWVRTILLTRRYQKRLAAHKVAVQRILTFQDKLIPLRPVLRYGHFEDVTSLIDALKAARAKLMERAGDGHGPVRGETELLHALAALADYASTDHPTEGQRTEAHNAVNAFTAIEEMA